MVVIELGYLSFVLSKEAAMNVVEALEKAEVYEHKYISKDDREKLGLSPGADYTHHVYPNEKFIGMRMISDDLYRMAKLAGKPEK